ncbi:MAG: amino acid adenylation domain-containing protein, partial [Chloroflexi bacterium]|nr:amino acid adenylation domain-containing protein [Chloroflexota bacterium]
VARVRTTALGAYAHQDLPFEMLVEAVQPERDLTRTPLFQVMFSLQNTPHVTIELPDLILEPLAVESTTAKFDLSLSLAETPHGLHGDIEYRTDLFEAATIERMVAHFQALLTAIVAQPEQRIDRLQLLDKIERRRLIDGWHHMHELPAELCVHQLFEAHALRTPDAIAVQHQDRSLSYAALNARANQIAHQLLALGLKPEDRVGVCLPRSLDLVAVLLGIAKAGAAYVPLDPAYPAERLQFMLDDAQIAVLVTQEALGATLPPFGGAILCVDRDRSEIAGQPTTAPQIHVQPENLLYVIYTSGSTGQPKGVLLSHRSLLNYITAVRERYALTPHDRVLQFASISFDASVEELFVPLANGAAIVLRSDEMLDSPQTFAATCAQWQISVLSLPTAFWNVLVDANARDEFQLPPSVRLIIMGGEHAALERVQQWQSCYGSHVQLVNLYGPTETTIAATGYVVPSPLPAALPDTPIGQPLSNVRAYVLDPQMELLPIGVAGELYIGGAALARGYHQRPDLTAERFVPDPFTLEPGARLYRTGDRVRFQPDGALLFLGRVDSQIKLRGYRIELGEIEAVLRRHPEVREAVVIVREDTPGMQRLVAYVVPKENLEPRTQNLGDDVLGSRFLVAQGAPGSADLRQYVGAHLPSYMVPSAIVVLDALPMTGSDKVDRRALPAPDVTDFEAATIVAPRNDEESWLVELWSELLGQPAVSITDNFFERGGHSLLAVRLMSQIQQRSGQSIPLATLLQAPTIEQLAVHLRQQPAGDWSPLVALQPQGSQRPLFLIHPIGGTVLCYAELARLLGPDQPVYGLQARGVEPGQLPHRSMEALAAEYLVALREVQPHGPYRLGGWSFGGVVAFEIARQLQEQGETIEVLALIDSGAPMPSQALPDDAAIFDDFIQDLGGLFGTSLGISAAELAPLPADERLAFILQHARNQNIVPPEIDLAQLRRLADLFHANLIALHGYAPTGTVEQIALLAAGSHDDQAQTLAASWQTWASEVIAEAVPGTHYSLLRRPQVQTVADWLLGHLANAKR